MPGFKRAHLLNLGRVQGVFFRQSSAERARQFRISGWVKNNPDGTVEILAEGREKDLKNFIDWCYNGVKEAMVEKIAVKWETYTGELNKFKITYD